MTGARLVRTSGTMLVAGGVLLAVMNVFTAVAFPGETAAQAKEPLWMPAFVLVAVSSLMLLFGLPVLYSRMAGPGGWMAQAGLIMIGIVGISLGFFGNFMQALVVPWVASSDPSMLSASAPTPAAFTGFYIVAGVIEVLGLVALAVPLLRGRLQPRWAGWALVLAAVFGVLSFVLPGSMSGNVGLGLLSAVPTVLLGAFFIGLGWQLRSESSPAAQSVAGMSAQPVMPQS